MSNPLMASLGLDAVEADPNALPDGKYGCVIFKSEYVKHKAKGSKGDAPKDHISHVITYKVNDGGTKNGIEKQEWFLIGREITDATGSVTGFESLMTEKQKPWYKKRLVDLGVPEAEVSSLDVTTLTGRPVTMGIRHKDGFENISFVELREVPNTATTANASILGSL